MENMEIRVAIMKANLKYWQVAKALGMLDSNFSRLLRKRLTKDEKTKILSAIETIRRG